MSFFIVLLVSNLIQHSRQPVFWFWVYSISNINIMAKRRKYGRTSKRGGTKVEFDGMQFQSKLELYCYQQLKKNKLFDKYEEESWVLLEPATIANRCYERQANGKGEFKQRSSAVRSITYTPDFTGQDYIIEVKGHPNMAFPLRWKMFKSKLHELGDSRTIFKPQSQKDIDEMIDIIKSLRT